MFQNKTLTLLAPAYGLPAWLSGGFLPYDIDHLQADDQHHWREVGPRCISGQPPEATKSARLPH